MENQVNVIFKDQNKQIFIRKMTRGRIDGVYPIKSKKGSEAFEAYVRENNLSEDLPDIHDLPFEYTYTRVGRRGSSYYHDLGNGRAVKISSEKYSVGKFPLVNFLRDDEMLPLPNPDREDPDLSLLRPYLNVCEETYLMVLSYLVFCLVGRGAFPVMLIHGAHGTAKTTLLKILKSIIDPNPVSLNSLPKSVREAAIVAQNQYLVTFDNVSRLSQEMSDFFCRLSTGGSFQTRKLYSDSNTLTLTYHKPSIFNGLYNFVNKADLRSRLLSIRTREIEGSRVSEIELWDSFYRDLPRILAGLYELCSSALRRLEGEQYKTDQRLIDFYSVSRAVFEVSVKGQYADSTSDFFEYCFSKYVDNNLDILMDDPVYMTILKLTEHGEWKGKAEELILEIDKYYGAYRMSKKNLPSTPASLGRHLSLMEPLLKNSPIEYRELRERVKVFSRKANEFLEQDKS